MAQLLQWLSQRATISTVTHDVTAPGMVTLAWRTGEPSPTIVESADGSLLFRSPAPRTEHRVTLAGGPGTQLAVCVRAGDHQRAVSLSF